MAAGRGSNVAVAGLKSRSQVQFRGRGSNVAVTGPKSLVGKVICVKFNLEFEVTERNWLII